MSPHTDQAQCLTEPDAFPVGATLDKDAADPCRVKRGTGPRSAAGKAIAARNSIGHGIYALSPVIEGLESAEDWSAYRQAMLSCLAPVGMLEETLAERSILTAWRMRRVAGYETRQILLPIREQTDKHSADDRQRRRQQEFLQWFGAAGDAVPVSETAAQWLLECACEVCRAVDDGVPDGGSDGVERAELEDELSESETCTVGEVRGLLGRLAERHGTTVAGVLSAVQQDSTREQEDAQRRLAVLCHAQLVPDDHTLEQVMRYEAHLARLFHRDLHELERLQATRNGQPVAAPVVMDIDLAGLPDGSPPLCRG